MTISGSKTLDPNEVERFAKLAEEWWNPNGQFRPLHKIGPVRLGTIRDACLAHFPKLDRESRTPLAGLTLLDVGCGGGLITEPLCRLGANVTGIDPAQESIAISKLHAEQQQLPITYRSDRIEELVAEKETFDVVTCLEVVEHIPDVRNFLATCASAVRPGGLFIGATISRTLKSYALAIVAAEYVLGWLPRGTHRWDRFLLPEEFTEHLVSSGLSNPRLEGMAYDPLADLWHRSSDTDVNYMIIAQKPAEQ